MTVKVLRKDLYLEKFKEMVPEALRYQETPESDVKGFVELMCELTVVTDKFGSGERKDTRETTLLPGANPKESK